MSEHLLKAGANITPREGDELARLPYLCTWFRTRSAIVLHLSNGTVQINFFQVSLLLCSPGPQLQWLRDSCCAGAAGGDYLSQNCPVNPALGDPSHTLLALKPPGCSS